ncbi:MAG: ATP synthase F1 subunit delta [Ruminococcaceae bacterium]|nr:ATP synthase F1 subunit delta [Oscillospiraceae bacterium]
MSEVSAAYAQGLFSLAKDEGLDETVLTQLQILSQSVAQEPQFLRLLSSPSLSKEERCGILDESFRGKVHIFVLNFLKLLTEKGYIRSFSQCVRDYEALYDCAHGILAVSAATAVPLTEEQAQRLKKKLESLTGKTVRLTNRIDSGVLGGVRLDYDGKRIDGTVKNRLDSIRKLLDNTVL